MKKLTAIPALCVLFGSLFAAIPANSQTITGTWVTTVYSDGSRMGTFPDPTIGAILFGNLPTPGQVITEIATSNAFVWTGGALPIPTYSDATPADPSEVFWTMQIEFEGNNRGGGPGALGVEIQYTGGTTATLSHLSSVLVQDGHCTFGIPAQADPTGFLCATVTAVAIRTTAPVAVSEQTWGETKDTYK